MPARPEPECFQFVDDKQGLIKHVKDKLLEHKGTHATPKHAAPDHEL